MRGKNIGENKEQESDQESVEKGAGGCHIKMIFFIEKVNLSGKLLKILNVSTILLHVVQFSKFSSVKMQISNPTFFSGLCAIMQH